MSGCRDLELGLKALGSNVKDVETSHNRTSDVRCRI